MRSVLKFIPVLAVAMLLMLAFRALAFTIYTVPEDGTIPQLRFGDRVVVNRWSYGLRTGGYLFRNDRWIGSMPDKGDLLAFNYPLDTTRTVNKRSVHAAYCNARPGDTITVKGKKLVVPGKCRMVKVEPENIKLLCNMYRIHEHRNAEIRGNRLFVDGKPVACASFSQNYYWVSTLEKRNMNDSRFFGFLPENHIIGRVVMRAYSVDNKKKFPYNLRKNSLCRQIGIMVNMPDTY